MWHVGNNAYFVYVLLKLVKRQEKEVRKSAHAGEQDFSNFSSLKDAKARRAVELGGGLNVCATCSEHEPRVLKSKRAHTCQGLYCIQISLIVGESISAINNYAIIQAINII